MSRQITTVRDCLDIAQSRFTTISTGNNNAVKWEEEKQFALQAFQGNDRLEKCTSESIQNALINVASVGLSLNPVRGYAYLVPEKNICSLKISFKGLTKIAIDSGKIELVKAEIVKENDEFYYNGPFEMPTHRFIPFGERGKPIGVYCVARLTSGGCVVDAMAWTEVMKIKSCAKTSYVWDKWPEEMAKKAIIKRASKQWPSTSATLDLAVSLLNESEGSTNLPMGEKEVQSVQAPVSTVYDINDAIANGELDAQDVANRAMTLLGFVFDNWTDLSGEHCAEVVELISMIGSE